MNLSGGEVLGALGAIAIAAVTAFGAWVTARAGRKASPYDVIVKRVVDLEKQREEDVERIEALQKSIGTLGREKADLHTDVIGLQRRVSGMFEDRDDLVAYITSLHRWLAAGAKPPAPPIPEHLADVVPKWIPGDGAEPPPRKADTAPLWVPGDGPKHPRKPEPKE